MTRWNPRLFLLLLLLTPAVLSAQDESPRVRPGDELAIRVWPDPDSVLSGRFRVGPEGQVYLPALGALSVAGRSVTEIRDELVERFSETVVSPVVFVMPRFRVSLLGAVRGPGLYFVEPPMTLMDLVSQAGGFTENAQPDRIRLIRGEEVFGVDAKAALESGAPTAAVSLQSGDRIVVPAAEEGVSLFQVVQTLLQITTLTVAIISISR